MGKAAEEVAADLCCACVSLCCDFAQIAGVEATESEVSVNGRGVAGQESSRACPRAQNQICCEAQAHTQAEQRYRGTAHVQQANGGPRG